MSQLDWYVRNGLKPRHLRLLVALDDFRNVGTVAANIHVSQPAVSKTIGEIERALGVKLFERTPRGLLPTAYGECLIRHARTLLSGLNQARDELRGLVSGASGRTAVGALPAATPALIPRGLALLKHQAPAVVVLIREGTLEGLLPELRIGRVDLIVGTLPAASTAPDLRERRLMEEQVTLVAAPHHPLARRKRLHWSDLRDFPWVLPPEGSLLREPLEAAFERHGLPLPTDRIETLSVQIIRAYVELTKAIAVLQGSVAKYYESRGLIAILPLELPKLVRPIGMVWIHQRPLSPSTKRMMQCLEDAAHGVQPVPEER